jgi:hypothetical protein
MRSIQDNDDLDAAIVAALALARSWGRTLREGHPTEEFLLIPEEWDPGALVTACAAVIFMLAERAASVLGGNAWEPEQLLEQLAVDFVNEAKKLR